MRFPKPVLLFVVAMILIPFVLSHCGYFSHSSLNRPPHSEHPFNNLPFKPGERFTYKVSYNGIYVGRVEWEYLGKQNMDNKLVDAISLFSDVKILKFFSIQSKEKLYIDSNTYLPLRVEREVEYLGRHEEIIERYNQKDSFVEIAKIDAKGKEERKLEVKAPIHPAPGYRSGVHNIVALLYFFPKDIKLNLGESLSFNLPTQKIKTKVVAIEILGISKATYETFRLEGHPRKFKVWLQKDKRIPLRMEFPVFLGRVTILKTE